jgi:FkbM family methyltransferase
VLGVLRNVAAIAGNADLPRRRLATTYLRLRAQAVRPPARAHLLDFELQHPDHGALVRLFEEIWLLRHYPFRPTRPDPVIVDCGANVGVAVLYFKAVAPGARVLAFEPEPTAFRLLTENVERNRLADVSCQRVALAGAAGEVKLRVPAPAHGGSTTTLAADRGWPSLVVPAEPLSAHLPLDVDFVKIDVEGAEVEVVEELVASGAIARVRELAIETHPGDPDALPRLLGLLAGSGFDYRIAVAGERFWDEQLLLVHAYRPTA